MRSVCANEIDAHLARGGQVVAASDRAARAARSSHSRRRQADGKLAWNDPAIRDWSSFVRGEWEAQSRVEWMVLDRAQEHALWAEIASKEGGLTALLSGSQARIARLAASAHKLLCDYAPLLLKASGRAGWQNDASIFSRWLASLDDRAEQDCLITAAQVQLELTAILESKPCGRADLLLIGFDRILPSQRKLLDAWGSWHQATQDEVADRIEYFEAVENQTELEACARWCRGQFEIDPDTHLLIICGDIAEKRGAIERVFSRTARAPFEFSLGIPLSRVPLIQSALLTLRWISGAVAEHELDFLFSSGRISIDPVEEQSLLRHMRKIREKQLQRPQWTWKSFLRSRSGCLTLPSQFVQRMQNSQKVLADFDIKAKPLRELVELVPVLLKEVGWPGYKTFTSEETQVADAWDGALENCNAIGFTGKRVSWPEFLSLLEGVLKETVFAPQSFDAPIQIVGPAESAGLTADAIWFLGADETNWPLSGSANPLLPLYVQRSAGMPHATLQSDWQLAQVMTERILRSTPKICFSYSRLRDGLETRPSRVVSQCAGSPQALPIHLSENSIPSLPAEVNDDLSKVSYSLASLQGGASALSAQSQCPFKAFAKFRLGAVKWDQARAGLTLAERGQILHEILHSIWSGPPSGLNSLEGLLAVADRQSFVAAHIRRILRERVTAEMRDRLPNGYIALEEERLRRLVGEWLEFESIRVPFAVVETEAERRVNIGGLSLHVRLDRLDRLCDDSFLIIDYKSGHVSPRAWDLPRPEDLQLPLYATFCLTEDQSPGGLVFANVRSGESKFTGKVRSATDALFPNLTARSALVNSPLTDDELSRWRRRIASLAADFLQGRAAADPRDYPKTCDRCGLQTICRIQEFPPTTSHEVDTEAADE